MRGSGRILGDRYRVDRELRRGAHSVTYLVTDLKTARPCVLKTLRESGAPPEDARLFEAQAAILAKLSHPRLPSFVEYLVEGEGAAREHLLVTRFHPGESLERLVEKSRLLTEAQAMTLLGRLVPLFTYLQEFDPPYVHRYLKASNIILGPDGRPCLVDFHFAAEGPGWRAWESTPPDEEGVAIAAPEVAVSGAVPASDVYALGMAIIHGMTGLDPHLLAREQARQRLRELLKAGEAFAAILLRMVDPALERRYPDARAVEADLAKLGAARAAGKPLPIPKPAPAPAPAKGEDAPRAPRSALPWVAIALLALIAAGGMLWFRGTQRGKPAGESLVVSEQAPAPASGPSAPAAAPEAAPAPGAAAEAPALPPPTPSAEAGQGTGKEAGREAGQSTGQDAGPVPAEPAPASVQQQAAAGPAAEPVADPAADPVVVEGRLLFDGKPVADAAVPKPLFWFRDEATKKEAKAKVEHAAGAFTVRGLPPGRYGMSVRIDLEPDNPNAYPGDLNAWAPFVLEAGRPLTLDVPLRKIIRLLQPVDNNVAVHGWEVPCGAGSPTPPTVVFAWEAVDPAASYDVRIDRLRCNRGYASAGSAFSLITNDTWVKVDLQPNQEGECYSFRLSAVKGGRQIGVMSTHGKSGLGWDHKFRVEP